MPENVRLREKATARCTAKIKRRVLKKHARKARAAPSEMLPGIRKEEGQKKAVDRTACGRAFH